MALTQTLTKTSIDFLEFRVRKEVVTVPEPSTTWFVNVGYNVITSQGETIHRDREFELTGADKTAVSDFYTTLVGKLETAEGIP
jgi:hypothetical protein